MWSIGLIVSEGASRAAYSATPLPILYIDAQILLFFFKVLHYSLFAPGRYLTFQRDRSTVKLKKTTEFLQ
jgi:hypothetical protein